MTKTKDIILNPGLKYEAPHLDGHVQWKGDLSKSLAAFQISHISQEDQMQYGLMIDFGALKDSKTSFVSLQIQGNRGIIWDQAHMYFLWRVDAVLIFTFCGLRQ